MMSIMYLHNSILDAFLPEVRLFRVHGNMATIKYPKQSKE